MFVIFMLVAFHYGMAQVYIYYLFCFEHKFNFPKHILDYGLSNNLVMAGNKSISTSPWCSNRLPLSYSYVQSHYWDVGFLKYYEWKQLPNFLLALPVVLLIAANTYHYVANNWDYTMRLGIFRISKKQMKAIKNYDRLVLPFVLHAAALVIFNLLFAHVQITTRMLASSSPVIYWYAADYFTSDRTFIKRQVIQRLTNQMRNGGSDSCNHVHNHIEMDDIRYFADMNTKQKLVLTFYIGYALIGTTLFSNFLPWT
jgi:phosphatidylinositol glycan class V